MDVRQILVVKVYRKKEMQEIRDRASGRVIGMYYPVILDDGDNTIDMTVPEDVYNVIKEDGIYAFTTRFDDRFRRENQSVKPKIDGLLFECPNNWRGDFLAKFNELVYPVVANKSISDKPISDKAISDKAVAEKTANK